MFQLSKLLALASSAGCIVSLLMDDRTAYGAFASETLCRRFVRQMPFLHKDARQYDGVAYSIHRILLAASSRVRCDARVGS